MKSIRVIVEHHADGFVAYPLNMRSVVVGQGDTTEEALADVRSAINLDIETFGADVLEAASEVLDAFLCETDVAT